MTHESPKFEYVGQPILWQNDVLQDILVEGNKIQVHISMEALQDANPELTNDEPLKQFAASRDRFMAIALGQLAKGNVEDGKVLVKTEHL